MTSARQVTSHPLIKIVALLLAIVSSSVKAEAPRDIWYQAFAEGYSALASSTDELSQDINRYCSNLKNSSEKEQLTVIKDSWLSAFSAWQAVRFLDFGPIKKNSRHWQLQFWPDKKNLIGRKVSYWVGADADITAEIIDQDGVAIQGFPAMEYLLFDKPADQLSTRQCQLLSAISEHTQGVTRSLQKEWKDFGGFYKDQDRYQDTTLISMLNALDKLSDKRLAEPMGLQGKQDNQHPNPYLADAWRSGQSITAIKASLQGINDYFLPGLNKLLSDRHQQPLYEKFAAQLNTAIAGFKDLPPAMKPLLKEDSGFRDLKSAYSNVEKLKQMAIGPLANELNVVRGFNASDGD